MGSRRNLIETVLSNKAISWKAKGIMMYLLSRPPYWKGQMYDIVHHCTDGKKSIMSAIRELKAENYLKTVASSEGGLFTGKHYEVIYPSYQKPYSNKKDYQNSKWIQKRNKIKQRDGNKCVKCGSSKNLVVHHLLYLDNENIWDVPDWYLVTLCKKCHAHEHIADLVPPNNLNTFPDLQENQN